eukprot:gnl/MRDRNA2_/MRDRNA2_30077_c0_seq1.p1 gnl/MRDRNA2_/MRDRNA2_30077_c0~~gnl/MRDRNA2_/MRDRNA2_30077_c0_seq1.p1  ORF type:complete len:653 (-),score=155.65 gnl/MRDRNA2_/MRDRNA2_30077_c0_seq1:353-2095(-)
MAETDVHHIMTQADINKNGKIEYNEFINWVFDAQDDVGELAQLKLHLQQLKESEIVSNSIPMHPPVEPSILDNTLLFLPDAAVREFKIEPNMDDKGDSKKKQWFGRVWELRALIAYQYQGMMKSIKIANNELSAERKAELEAVMNDPLKKMLLKRVAAHWKGAALRNKMCLSNILGRLRFANLRGTLIYAHGSGGCSWDNFRICRMIAGLGFMVIAPDGFAYPPNTAMGQMRHKALQPLHQANDQVDYWANDLLYASGSQGTHTYSTAADAVLTDADGYRDLYERCYQLRRAELHFIIHRLPMYIKTKGFFLGGTSEGAMTISRFDDQRYGDQVMGRFINSYSVEYCYFTPLPEDGEIGGQIKVPTLNIIGTKDEYFGPEDSIAKIVAEDPETGYGDKDLTGNAYKTFVRQGLHDALVAVLEDGEHSPCTTHDNFLRQVFDLFFTRPHDIWELPEIWGLDPAMKNLVKHVQGTHETDTKDHVRQVFVPKMKFPQKMALREVEAMRMVRGFQEQLKQDMEAQEKAQKARQAECKAMLDGIRDSHKPGEHKWACKEATQTYYSKGEHHTAKEDAKEAKAAAK